MTTDYLYYEHMLRLSEYEGNFFLTYLSNFHVYGAGKTLRDAVIDWRHGQALEEDKERSREAEKKIAAFKEYGIKHGLFAPDLPAVPAPAKKPWYAKLLFWQK